MDLARLLDAGNLLLRLSKERAQEALRLNHGGTNDEVKAEIELLLKEGALLVEAYDVLALVVKRALANRP